MFDFLPGAQRVAEDKPKEFVQIRGDAFLKLIAIAKAAAHVNEMWRYHYIGTKGQSLGREALAALQHTVEAVQQSDINRT